MTKKVWFGLAGLVAAGSVGLSLWAHAVLSGDAIRATLASQISQAVGQPVTIGGLTVAIYPRLTVVLTDVSIGKAREITVRSLDVGTDMRALLSRRIEHAALHLEGARVALPLPPLTTGAASTSAPAPAAPSRPPVEIVSIDEITFHGVEIVGSGRTLTGDIEVVPEGRGVLIRKVALHAEDASLTATGRITDLAGPVGDIAIKAGELNFDRLLAFATDFSGAASGGAAAGPTPTIPATLRLNFTIEADRATIGGLTIDQVSGRMMAEGPAVRVEPLAFGLFGGRYDGSLGVDFRQAVPTFRWRATVTHINVARAVEFAGSPNTASGMLSGNLDLIGQGRDAAMAMKTVHGAIRVDVTDGIIRNLGLVRSVGAATTLSLEGLQRAAGAATQTDEPFSRLGATLTLADGSASTDNLTFEALDLSFLASGTAQLDASAMNLRSRLQLSESLSQQVHSKMLRLSQDQGRVTLPATITGPLAAPIVTVDTGDIARRAIRNTATSSAPNLIKRGINGLFRRP